MRATTFAHHTPLGRASTSSGGSSLGGTDVGTGGGRFLGDAFHALSALHGDAGREFADGERAPLEGGGGGETTVGADGLGGARETAQD